VTSSHEWQQIVSFTPGTISASRGVAALSALARPVAIPVSSGCTCLLLVDQVHTTLASDVIWFHAEPLPFFRTYLS
jgi:hypothetical protein